MWLDGTGARDVIPTGVITTGKQLTSDGAGTLYWGDREGCRVSRVRIDETSLTDLVVNIRDNSWLQECVGVAVDTARGYLYWTQKGPSNGGKGRIFREAYKPRDTSSKGHRGIHAGQDVQGHVADSRTPTSS